MNDVPLPGLEDLAPEPDPTAGLVGLDADRIVETVRARVAAHNRDHPLFGTISPDRRRTMERAALLEHGYHPLTRTNLIHPDELDDAELDALDGDAPTCGSCAFLLEVGYRARTYRKCAKVGHTRGPATDVRVSWPGCILWEPSPTLLEGTDRLTTRRPAP